MLDPIQNGPEKNLPKSNMQSKQFFENVFQG